MGLADRVPPNLKFAILSLTIPIFTLYVLALVGCISVSPGIPGIFLFLLTVNGTPLRVGYFAICAVNNSTSIAASQNGTSIASDGTICVPTLGFEADELSIKLFGTKTDVIPTLDLALNLQRKILVPLILIAAFFALIGAIFFALAKVTQMKLKDPNNFASAMKQLAIFKPATLVLLWSSVLFAFAAAVASTMATGALNFIIPVLAKNISVEGGKVLQALQYLSFVFNAFFALGATLMLADKLERQEGMMGADGYPGAEKGLDGQESYEEAMMQQQQQQAGMEDMGEQYPEGAEYGQEEQQFDQQYAEGQYPQEEYAQQMDEDPQMQQQQQQQQPYPG